MKCSGIVFYFVLIITLAACTGDSSSQYPDNGTSGSDSTLIDTAGKAAGTDASNAVAKPDCPVAGKVLEENTFWADRENLLVVLSADQETRDPELGESHRILQVFDGSTCEQVFREILPVNFSADFPYYLSQITYNNISKLVAIRGFDKFFVLDLDSKKLSGPFLPEFLNERYVDDASSGSITRMEVWENYLVGFAASIGAFVYDMSNPAKPEAVLPVAEYEVDKGIRYNSLFLLKSMDEKDVYQALLPVYDSGKQAFRFNPLFEKPLKISLNIPKTFRNNRYIVLKELLGGNNSRPIAIDMEKMKKVELPADIAAKKDTEIIEWMKKN